MSAEVTAWPERLLLTAAVVAVIALTVWAMWWGWRRRAAKEETEIPAPPIPPEHLSKPVAVADGKYIGTVKSGEWMVRVLAHGLGAPAQARLSVHPEGVLIDRDGASAVFIPSESLRSVGVGRGLAGTVVERDGMAIIGWDCGGVALDTGFRSPVAADQHLVTQAAAALVPDQEDQPA